MSERYKYEEPENKISKVIVILCFILLVLLFILFIVLNKLYSDNDSMSTGTAEMLSFENIDMKPFESPHQGFLDAKNREAIKKTNRGVPIDIIPQSTYKIYGRVFTKHHVPSYIEYGELMPYDMVIGWGKMAEPEMFKTVKFEYQFYDRYVWWTFDRNIQGDPDELSLCFSNNHIIPANTVIRKELEKVKVKDIVYIEGYLVNLVIHGKNGAVQMDTSLWRDDEGEGACEIIYITRLVTRNGEFK